MQVAVEKADEVLADRRTFYVPDHQWAELERLLDGFRCGVDPLDAWLAERARTSSASGASPVLVVADESGTVVAYYTLSTGSLQDVVVCCARLSHEVGFVAVLAHPVDESADAFWRRFGFVPAPTQEPMLALATSHLTGVTPPTAP